MVTNAKDKWLDRIRGGRSTGDIAVVAVRTTPFDSDVHRGSGVIRRYLDPLIGTVFGALLFWSLGTMIPTSIWYEVRSVQVLDTQEGVSPRMIVDRTIRMPVDMDWSVVVYRVTDDGYLSECRSTGHNEYDPSATLPPALDLDWWTFPVECKLKPGNFVVRTLWTLNLFGFLRKPIRAVSNVFTVTSIDSTTGGPNGESKVNPERSAG